MTKRERIAALEKRIDALEREVASIPRWHWTYPNTPWVPPAIWSPFYVGDGTTAGLPSTNPTITWATGSNSPSGVNQ